MVDIFPANGSDQGLNERMRAWLHKVSPDNLQLRHHLLIQQINRLLEPLILHKCRISLFCRLYRSMTKQMLNVSDSSTVGSNHLDRLSAFLRFMVW